MIKHLPKFGFLFALIMIWGSCEKESPPRPQVSWGDYIGKWENINAFTADLHRIIITQKERGQLSVQLLGSCGMELCEQGLFSYRQSELKESNLSMQILWKEQELQLRLSLTTSGKLELAAMGDLSDTFETQYFSWVQTASFYQQITQEDVRPVYLAGTPINGGPWDPDNQLTPGSILIFQTNERRLGKIQVRGNGSYLSIQWQTWDADGTIYQSSNYFPLHKIGYYDLDNGQLDDTPDHRYSDFYWSLEGQRIRWLEPLNGAAFALYHLE